MLRRAIAAFWFVLLLLGQQAAALHAVAHAAERLDGTVPAQFCDQCALGAQVSSALGTTVPELPALAADFAPPLPGIDLPVLAEAPVYFRSRAPPTSL
jgi:hypothetical protein